MVISLQYSILLVSSLKKNVQNWIFKIKTLKALARNATLSGRNYELEKGVGGESVPIGYPNFLSRILQQNYAYTHLSFKQ